MNAWTRGVVVAMLVWTPLQGALAGSPSLLAHEVKVRRLLELTGAGDLGKQTMDAMLTQFESLPEISKEFIVEFKKAAKPEDLVNLIVPIYMHNLSEADVDGAIAFYESPAGKHFTAAMPAITAESMTAGQQWGTKVATQVVMTLSQTAP